MIGRHPYHIQVGNAVDQILLARLATAIRAVVVRTAPSGAGISVVVPMDLWAVIAEASRIVALEAKASPGGQAAHAAIDGVQRQLKHLYQPSTQMVLIPLGDWRALEAARTAIEAEPGVPRARVIEAVIESGQPLGPGDAW